MIWLGIVSAVPAYPTRSQVVAIKQCLLETQWSPPALGGHGQVTTRSGI